MITKKEDLIGTYIKNDNGELRELYIAACEALLVDGTPRDLMMSNDEWLGPNIDCKVIGVYEGGMFISNSYCSDGKELTISDLKPIPTETPEEKEALDAIEQVEWNGEGLPPVGVECEVRFRTDGEWTDWFSNGKLKAGYDSKLWFSHDFGDCVYPAHDVEFRKAETPEAKQEREELEAAYDLYIDLAYVNGATSFDAFKTDEKLVNFWLRIVRKTGYRKGE